MKGALLELQVRLLNLRTFSSRANSAGTFGDESYCGIVDTMQTKQFPSVCLSDKRALEYYQAVGCYDAVEAHKRYSPVDRLIR